jgi:hypothetical protein
MKEGQRKMTAMLQQVKAAVPAKSNVATDEGNKVNAELLQHEDNDSDGDSDCSFVDSDFDVEEGDDDLFSDNVDREVDVTPQFLLKPRLGFDCAS